MTTSRRSFLSLFAAAAATFASPVLAWRKPGIHPDPRPGIDAREVLTREQLEKWPDKVKDVYDLVREIPQIADGIGCYCGCANREGYRSLLTCFYEKGMARGCPICQGEAKLAHKRHKEGQSLDQIRRAIDARYS